MLSKFDRWLTTPPDRDVTDTDCGVCHEPADVEYDERPQAWGEVCYPGQVITVCSLECALIAVEQAPEEHQPQALRYVVEHLLMTDDFVAATLEFRSGREEAFNIWQFEGAYAYCENGVGVMWRVGWSNVVGIVSIDTGD